MISSGDDNEQAVLSSWQQNANAWQGLIERQGIASRRVTDPAIVQAVLDLCPEQVLDVGCGEGWLCRTLSAHGIACLGVDGIDTLIQSARHQHPQGNYLCLDYDRFPGPLPSTAFDLAVCNFSLFGKHSVERLIASLIPLLHPGGHLLIQTLHPAITHQGDYREGWRNSDWQSLEGDFGPAPPWYFRPLAAWVALLQQHGLEVSLQEPLDPANHQPLSLILHGRVHKTG